MKVSKSIALAMLYVKGDYYLNEFISALKNAIELAMPIEDVNMSDEKEVKQIANNVFEGF